jgi:hypothetical protein
MLGVASVSATPAFAHAGTACRIPRLKGLTLAAARARVAHAGCRLRVSGAALRDAGAQTVARQSPGARARSANVTVWLNPLPAKRNEESRAGPATPVVVAPLPQPEPSPPQPARPTCAAEGLPVAGSRIREPELEGPFGEEHITPGPTELVSGFFLDGGPAPPPGCEWPAQTPSPGTVEVTNASGEVVATQASEDGHFVEISLPPGTYTIASTFVSATFCKGIGTADCVHPTETYEVTIAAGYTVRKDFIIQIA